ncbi:MAG: pseudaminic acid synthase [Hyphomicrobiaceae bacterium]|nr:pseudaminic acid synthase [Hyphomicrobiaceae bacterium]
MTTPTITIAGRRIGADAPPYIIAEVSANHNGRIEAALELITIAKKSGADAVKLQTYTADTITIDHDGPDFQIKGGLWDGQTLYNLYKEAQTPFEWHPALFEHGRKLGIDVFSSPFDDSAIELLESLDAPAFKIASFEAIDLPLIRRAARSGKPLIISTGMTSPDEIQRALDAAREGGCRDVALLHCVSEYPAAPDTCNLRTIPDLSQRYGVVAGLSDHTMGTAVSVAAVALGAALIEKHFTDSRAKGGPDSAFSLEPPELTELCNSTRIAHQALGAPHYKRSKGEEANRQFRRSLYVVQDIPAGAAFTRENVRSIRPGYGLPPDRIADVLGRRAARDLARGTALTDDALAE